MLPSGSSAQSYFSVPLLVFVVSDINQYPSQPVIGRILKPGWPGSGGRPAASTPVTDAACNL
jgi:hypothetical protein